MVKKNSEEKLDIKKLNEIILSSSYIIKIAQILFFILGIYGITLILEKWGLVTFILSILKILAPFFIGFVIAWLLNPAVNYLHKRKINRPIGTIIIYLTMLLIIYLSLNFIIPFFSDQINDFVAIIPNIIDTIETWLTNLFNRFDGNGTIDVITLKTEVFAMIDQFEANITTSLPSLAVNFVTNFISGVGTFVVGLLLGFFILFDFNSVSAVIIKLIPKHVERDFKMIMRAIDTSLKHFVQSILFLSLLVFIFSTIGFYLIGLRAPVIFGLICGITNVIPIIGPYIGGVIAVIVGLVQSTTIGLLTLAVVAITQFVECELISPLVLGKTMKLHPVTIIVSLLIFGHLFGIVGMLVSTPIIAIIKILFIFFNEKFDIFNFEW